jgi:hypothetical protein
LTVKSISADRPILTDAVLAAPNCGNKPLAIAAPPCTLMMAPKTAGNGGTLILLFIGDVQFIAAAKLKL